MKRIVLLGDLNTDYGRDSRHASAHAFCSNDFLALSVADIARHLDRTRGSLQIDTHRSKDPEKIYR